MKWNWSNDMQAEPTQSAPPLNETVSPNSLSVFYEGPPFVAVKTTNPNVAAQEAIGILLVNLRLLLDRAISVHPMDLRGFGRVDVETLVEQAEAVQKAINEVDR